MSTLSVSSCRGVGARATSAHNIITCSIRGFGCALLGLLVSWAPQTAAQFLPPGIVNPFADIDPGQDLQSSHVIEEDGTIHVVWASSNPYPGIDDSDADILYSRNAGSGWTAPEAVNSFAPSDLDVDEHPKLVLGTGGKLYCVWQSQHNYNGAGNDWDIFFSEYDDSTGWSVAEAVNSDASTDNLAVFNDDTRPNLAVRGDGGVVFTWQVEVGNNNPGLFQRLRSAGGWANTGAVFDSPCVGPVAMVTTEDGDIVAVWEKIEAFNSNHYIVWCDIPDTAAFLCTPGLIADSSSDNRYPQVATTGSGPTLERHFVWASKDSTGGIGSDYDIKHYVRRAAYPTLLGPYTVNSTAATDGSSSDVNPSICIEAGGALHVVWESNVDFFSGTDLDTYYSHNGSLGSQWAPLGFLGLNAPFDNPGEDDYDAEIRCGPLHVLSGMWTSLDDLGGTVGKDRDIFHALGLGRRYHRVQQIVDWADNDNDLDARVRMAQWGGVVHLIWQSGNSGGGLSTGPDMDIYHLRYREGAFGDVEAVNTGEFVFPAGDDHDPDVTVGPDGLVHAVWSSEHDIGSSGTDGDIFYAWTDDTGIWSVPELVNASGTSDSIADLYPRIEIDGNGTLHVVWYEMSSGMGGQLAYARRTGTGWTAKETPTLPAATDWNPLSYDLAVEPGGTAHVVWGSWADHGGSGSDADIFWSSRVAGSWGTAQIVNDYGTTDMAFDETPRVEVAPDGEVYAVWSSSHDPGTAGTDADLFIAKRDPPGENLVVPGWQPTFLLLEHFQADSGEDTAPEFSVGQDTIDVVWVSDEGLAFGVAGADLDIFHAQVQRMSSLPSAAAVGVVNANGFADSGDDEDPALAVLPGGTVVVSWESTDDLGGLIGTDLDIVMGRLGEIEGLFADGFETGSAANWSMVVGD